MGATDVDAQTAYPLVLRGFTIEKDCHFIERYMRMPLALRTLRRTLLCKGRSLRLCTKNFADSMQHVIVPRAEGTAHTQQPAVLDFSTDERPAVAGMTLTTK